VADGGHHEAGVPGAGDGALHVGIRRDVGHRAQPAGDEDGVVVQHVDLDSRRLRAIRRIERLARKARCAASFSSKASSCGWPPARDTYSTATPDWSKTSNG
jgi:hypothetical protein